MNTLEQDVLDLLVSPTSAPAPAREVDDAREDALAMARTQFRCVVDEPDDVPPEHVLYNTPWTQMAHCMFNAGTLYGMVIAEGDGSLRRVIRELNAFLRQTLILYTVDYNLGLSTSEEQKRSWLPLLFLARQRALATLDKSHVAPRIDAHLRAPLLDKYESLRRFVQKQDGTMLPAVHP